MATPRFSNRAWFPQPRRYLPKHRPPTLIMWGPQRHYMPEKSGRACLQDLPDAEFHLLNGGHWLLETHPDQVVALMRGFLARCIRRGDKRATPHCCPGGV